MLGSIRSTSNWKTTSKKYNAVPNIKDSINMNSEIIKTPKPHRCFLSDKVDLRESRRHIFLPDLSIYCA